MKSIMSRFQTFVTPLRMFWKLGGDRCWSVTRFQILIRSYELLALILIGRRAPIEIRLIFRKMPFSVVFESASDFAVIREVFLDEEYLHPHIAEAKHLFDVGANIGMASVYLACLYPDATIYAFEPDPALYKKVTHHARAFKNIKAFPLALANHEGEQTFYMDPMLPLSGSLIQRPENRTEIIVQTSTLSAMADQLGITKIDLVKFDIEGGERMLFEFDKDRNRAARVIGEVHLDLLKMDKEQFANMFSGFDAQYTRRTGGNRYLFYAVLKDNA